ncbi:MAG TPA: Crp/Fnr family transcriptional regulator [Steroidobacteraceae bacterium]|nr:Crp/Fnr family transcriptional regulator [Steroidobacteraceae bacterium]
MSKQPAWSNGTDAASPREPALVAIPFLKEASGSDPVELLSDAQREKLVRLATVRELPARTVVYRAGSPADSVFIIGEGVVKSYRDLASGRRRIAAFFFARDLFGLAEAGYYVNTVQTITPVRLYDIKLEALTALFKREPDIELQFLCKVVHVLREVQHHTIIIGRRDAAGRLAMLLRLLQKQSLAQGHRDIALPMSRSDIANYLGLSPEAVSRASRRLERQGIVEFHGRGEVRVIDRQRFAAIAAAA